MLLSLQLEKVYDPKNEEDDMREMEEERLRMREHVMKNVREDTLGVGVGAWAWQQAQHSPSHWSGSGSLGGHQPGPSCDPGGVPGIDAEEGVWGHWGRMEGEDMGTFWY